MNPNTFNTSPSDPENANEGLGPGKPLIDAAGQFLKSKLDISSSLGLGSQATLNQKDFTSSAWKMLLKNPVTVEVTKYIYTKLGPTWDDLLHLLVIAHAESRFDLQIRTYDPKATAKGLFQVNKATAESVWSMAPLARHFMIKFGWSSPLSWHKPSLRELVSTSILQAQLLLKRVNLWKWENNIWTYYPPSSYNRAQVSRQITRLDARFPGWRLDYDKGRTVLFFINNLYSGYFGAKVDKTPLTYAERVFDTPDSDYSVFLKMKQESSKLRPFWEGNDETAMDLKIKQLLG